MEAPVSEPIGFGTSELMISGRLSSMPDRMDLTA
jgi:hypothetical protein